MTKDNNSFIDSFNEDINPYFIAVVKLIIYAYQKLAESSKVYSRQEIHKKIKEKQQNVKAILKLEDYLRNDLIPIIRKNRTLFGLDAFVFDVGVEEIEENIGIGFLDIKISSPFLTPDNVYFIFECKRINKYSDEQKYYIEQGIKRFTDKKYYAESEVNIAGMIGFVEVDIEKNKKGIVPIKNIVQSLKKRLKENYKDEVKMLQNLKIYKLKDKIKNVASFKEVYVSKHKRKDDDITIEVYHIFLDYYNLIDS